MFPKGKDLQKRRARKRSTQLLFRNCPADRVVVTVEEPAKLFAKWLVIRKERTKHERLEKPGRMGLVPLHWTGIRAGLHHLILSGGSFCNRTRHRSHGSISHAETTSCSC